MKRHEYKALMAQGKTIITAHSGCEGTPDNSLEHIQAAIASGAEIIEVDLRLSASGMLHLSHDETSQNCPSLEELFRLIAGEENMAVNLDAKISGLIPSAMALARSYGLSERILFTGECNADRALAVSLGAEVWHSMWQGDSIPEAISFIQADGSPCLNVDQVMITPEYDQALRSIGRGFSVWTVNDEANLRRYLEMGVTNITTRIPVLAMKLRKEIQGV